MKIQFNTMNSGFSSAFSLAIGMLLINSYSVFGLSSLVYLGLLMFILAIIFAFFAVYYAFNE